MAAYFDQVIAADLNLGFKNPNRKSAQVDLDTEIINLLEIQSKIKSHLSDLKSELEQKYILDEKVSKFPFNDLEFLIGDSANVKSIKNIFIDLAVSGKIKNLNLKKANFKNDKLGKVIALEYGKNLTRKDRDESGSIPVLVLTVLLGRTMPLLLRACDYCWPKGISRSFKCITRSFLAD